MLDLSDDLYTPTPAPQPTTPAPLRPVASIAASSYLMDDPERWTATQLRDYVMTQIEALHGAQPRDERLELGTFKGFHARWGRHAGTIAKFAFEQLGGWWRQAPITRTRFTKGNDPFFAAKLAERLELPSPIAA